MTVQDTDFNLFQNRSTFPKPSLLVLKTANSFIATSQITKYFTKAKFTPKFGGGAAGCDLYAL